MSRTCPGCSSQYDDEVVRCPGDGCVLLSTPGDPLLGRIVGSYRIAKLLGKGGMGAVYLAEHPVIGSRVAIKFLHPQYASDGRIVERFFNEARAVNLIGHDNIVTILDLSVTEEGRHYFVMEYLQGRSLSHLLASEEAVPLEVAGPILLQCCEALQAAHDRGIVHRDLKPENVHLTVHKGRKNFVKLLDFGIAKLLDGAGQSTGQTRTGMVVGTPGYMSPEQASGRSSAVDGRSDVFSLGVLMFQMATGRLPFPVQGFAAETGAGEWGPPPRPGELAAGIPEEHERIVLRCLEQEPDARFASMRELHDAIERCMKRLGVDTGLPHAGPADVKPRATMPLRRSFPATDPSWTSPGRPPRRPLRAAPPRRRPVAVVAAAAAIGISLLVAGYLAGGAGRAATAPGTTASRDVPAPPETVFLAVVSNPHGAMAEASWDEGKKTGITPLEVEVPKGTRVRVEFVKAGFLPYAVELAADNSQLVEGKLLEEPRPPPQVQPARARKKEPPRPPPPPKPAESNPVDLDDDAMEIVF